MTIITQMIIIKNKKISETPLELINRLRSVNIIDKNTKATYAGRLDPMARGLTIILTGEDCKNKNQFLNLDKEYEFEILSNIHTDSLDILGKIDNIQYNKSNTFCIENQEYKKYPHHLVIYQYIKSLTPSYNQKYPNFSSKTFNGKQLHTLAKNNILPTISHQVYIKRINYISSKTMHKDELSKDIINRITNVNGDFRQNEIQDIWQKQLNQIDQDFKFIIYKFKIKVSSGFYIRQLVDDISKHFEIPMTTYSINRISIGKYNKWNNEFYNIYYKIKSFFIK